MKTNKGEPILVKRDLVAMFADPTWAAKFPPVMTLDQLAELLQISKETLYNWARVAF